MGWEDQTVHFFMGPDNSGVQHSLTLIVDHYLATDDLAEYAQQKTDQYLQSLSGAELTKSEQVTLDNGLPAWIAVCKTVPSEDQVVIQKRVYVIVDKVGYIFCANFSRKTIKTIGKLVMKIISSLVPTS
jgi:hypothetical protein